MGTILYILVIVSAVWVIYDAWVVNDKLSNGNKAIWTVFAILFSVITAIVYYFTQKK